MNFSKVDLIPILRSSMPRRFADMPPSDFELFVAQFFRDTGCVIEQVKHGSDFGIDVIVTRERKRIAIQVKRYAKANRVGVSDVNQAVGGRKFYNCDQAIFITTSDFTQPARRLAQQTDVELWNWNEFQKRLSAAYLSGKSYQEYFRAPVSAVDGTEPVAARVLRFAKLYMKGNYEGALFYVGLSNRTAKNINVQIVGATYITAENNQYSMRDYLQGYFMAGVIYAGCTVEACVIFDLAQVRHVRRGHTVVLEFVTDGTKRSVVLKVPSGSRVAAGSRFDCFVATAAFGTEMATEVVALRTWRDRRLRTTAVGQLALAMYYSVSPTVARWIRYRPAVRMVVRGALRPFVWFATWSIRRAR